MMNLMYLLLLIKIINNFFTMSTKMKPSINLTIKLLFILILFTYFF